MSRPVMPAFGAPRWKARVRPGGVGLTWVCPVKRDLLHDLRFPLLRIQARAHSPIRGREARPEQAVKKVASPRGAAVRRLRAARPHRASLRGCAGGEPAGMLVRLVCWYVVDGGWQVVGLALQQLMCCLSALRCAAV